MPDKAYIGGVVVSNQISGSARRIFELCSLLYQKKYKVTIFTYDGVPPEWIKVNVPLRPFDYLDFEYPDVLICPDYENYYLISSYDTKLKIVFLHNATFLKKYLKIAEEPKTLVFTMNPQMVQFFRKDRVIFYPFGINTNIFSPSNQNLENVTKNILFILPSDIKYIYDYISFISSIYEEIKNINVTFSILAKNLSKQITNIYFHIHNNIPTTTLVNLYRNIYLAVDLRRKLEWNNCALELLAVGKPVVCFPDGANLFIEDFHNGIFLKHYDSYFIAGIISLLVNDKYFYNHIKKNGFQVIKNHAYEIGVERIEKVFNSYGIIE
ncbi:MAG: hypothetical protein ACK4NF_03615 [Planctomycetota bacterium]